MFFCNSLKCRIKAAKIANSGTSDFSKLLTGDRLVLVTDLLLVVGNKCIVGIENHHLLYLSLTLGGLHQNR